MITPLQQRGYDAEAQVADYLTQRGYTILARNYTCRSGEIDIVARKQEVIACVEVKMRATHYFPLSQVVNYTKQKRIISAAHKFIAGLPERNRIVIRFDVALVHEQIDYFSNAFTQSERAL